MDGHQVPAKKQAKKLKIPEISKWVSIFIMSIMVALRLSDSMIILEPQNKPNSNGWTWWNNRPFFPILKIWFRNHPIETANHSQSYTFSGPFFGFQDTTIILDAAQGTLLWRGLRPSFQHPRLPGQSSGDFVRRYRFLVGRFWLKNFQDTGILYMDLSKAYPNHPWNWILFTS